MVMTSECALRERLPLLWRAIEDAHYSYLETDDSPDKLRQRKKLDGYIAEYLSLVPHECKFGLSATGKVFQRTVSELPEFSAYRAGRGWAALARYAANLLAQPWRKEYKTIRLYSGYYKHEVESCMVGAEILLQAMGYKPLAGGRLGLDAPVCPDMVAAISRDALIAHQECQIMCAVWERLSGACSWADVAHARATRPGDAAAAARALRPADHYTHTDTEIYSNLSPEPAHTRLPEIRHPAPAPYVLPPAPLLYPPPELPACNPLPMMTPYGPVPCYYPIQPPYMVPAPVYAPIKQATNIPLNGYPPLQYGYPYPPAVPTGRLIELDAPTGYENGLRKDSRLHADSSRRNSTTRSGFSDVSLPSLPRSDTQPALSGAREDGMGTYESWDYVFRNLSSKDAPDTRSRHSPSLERDSRTLERLDREERRSKYQPTTLDLEDGLQALTLDRSYDDQLYRTARVNENLARMKQEQEVKRAKQAKRQSSEERRRRVEPCVPADGLAASKAADKVRLLTKKDVKDRKDIIKQQNGNGSASSLELRRARKKLDDKPRNKPPEDDKPRNKPAEDDKPRNKPAENGVLAAHFSKSIPAGPSHSPPPPTSFDLATHLVVSLDEPDSRPHTHNGDARTPPPHPVEAPPHPDAWECGTCTYINKGRAPACEMCGKSRGGPGIQPLRAGGRECPACTLVNERDARACDACGTSLEHCPTYI